MNKLEQLYQKRDTFLEFGSEVPAALAAQIAEAEKEMLQMELLPIVEDSAMKTLPQCGVDGKVVIAMEYDAGSLSRIAIATDASVIDSFDVVKEVTDDDDVEEEVDDDDEDDDDDGDDDSSKIHRSKSIGFSVHFADGKVIKERSAIKTMIEAFKYMGLERASNYDETFKGYTLISTKQRITEDGHKWQRYVDGWWIYVNLSNNRKIRCIKRVGKMLNIPLEIELDDENGTATVDEPKKQKGKRAMFSLNGGISYCKNLSVLETVRYFISQFPDATFGDVVEMFPKQLQGSYGVVMTLDEIERSKRHYTSEDKRWFLQPDKILTAADGVRFAVSTQWGDNYASFQKHVTEQLGWTLEEV